MQFGQSKIQLFVQIEIRQYLLFAQSKMQNIPTVSREESDDLVTFNC